MKVIGLTGGIGSGKSTVGRLLARRGATVIDADKIGHELLEADAGLKRELVAGFGEGILGATGKIERRELARIVFADAEKLELLNRLTHPRIYQAIRSRLADLSREAVPVAVVEAPLLLEADWALLVDEIWVVVASREMVIKRLHLRSGMKPEEAEARIAAQLSTPERLNSADVVIENNGSRARLGKQVAALCPLLFDTTAS